MTNATVYVYDEYTYGIATIQWLILGRFSDKEARPSDDTMVGQKRVICPYHSAPVNRATVRDVPIFPQVLF